jgi:hypothetical protein
MTQLVLRVWWAYYILMNPLGGWCWYFSTLCQSENLNSRETMNFLGLRCKWWRWDLNSGAWAHNPYCVRLCTWACSLSTHSLGSWCYHPLLAVPELCCSKKPKCPWPLTHLEGEIEYSVLFSEAEDCWQSSIHWKL